MLSPLPAFAEQCLTVESNVRSRQQFQTTSGDLLRLRFKHSIYGSTVEEIFTLREHGLQLTRLRYSEARLVAFYGHEQARQENGAWIVTPDPVLYPALSLRVSQDAAMAFTLASTIVRRDFPLLPDSNVFVTVAPCDQTSND